MVTINMRLSSHVWVYIRHSNIRMYKHVFRACICFFPFFIFSDLFMQLRFGSIFLFSPFFSIPPQLCCVSWVWKNSQNSCLSSPLCAFAFAYIFVFCYLGIRGVSRSEFVFLFFLSLNLVGIFKFYFSTICVYLRFENTSLNERNSIAP